jgi:hypothetical protein
MHPHESLIRTHVEGEGTPREQQEVAEHLKDCSDCREFLSFVQDFSETAKDLAQDEIAADEPHAKKSVIIAYEEGKLDSETALNLRAHMLFCDECAETYYLLKRMRAPSWTEVVIGVIQRAKETLLEALEITGMGELIPVPATITKGSSAESEEGQSRIEIAQHVTDSDDEADILFSLEPEGNEAVPTFCLRIEIDPPKGEWRAQFYGADGKRLASVPLSLKSQIIFSNFPMGSFTAQVEKGDELLAECNVTIRRSGEQTSS